MKQAFRFGMYGVVTLIGFILLVYVVIYLTTKAYIYNSVNDVPATVVALVPGAALAKGGALSSIFVARVEGAVALYTAKKVSKILVSGDNSTISHNEVDPARDYLIAHGVPAEDIFLDYAGFDTYSSMYRARDIFGVTTMIVVTQSFHLPRAVFIARHLGIEAYGLRTDIPNLSPANYVREIFANEKAVLELLLGRSPKFLGESIPITGDGRNYP